MAQKSGNSRGRQPEDRGASPILGIVLLFGMVFAGAALVIISGSMVLDALDDQTSTERAQQTFQQVDHDLSTLTFSGEGSTSMNFDAQSGEKYELRQRGTLSVTVANRFGDSCSKDVTLGTLQHENGGGTMAYQAGGIWRETESGSTMVSSPDIEYTNRSIDDDTFYGLDFAVVNLSGSVGSGEHRASLSSDRPGRELTCLEDDSFGYPSNVTITVEDTPYHDAWYRFLRDEFDAVDPSEAGAHDNVVRHDESNRRVVLEASLGPDRPFNDYVDLDPTIYSGLHVTSGPSGKIDFDQPMTIDAYDSRRGNYTEEVTAGNTTTDFLTADVDDRLKLKQRTDIDGYPVVNGKLQAQKFASVSPAAFTLEKHPSFNADPEDVPVFEINETFDSIGDIDDNVDRAHDYLDSSAAPGSGPIDSGEYYAAGDFSLTDTVIDTSSGDVHVAVSGDLELEDVTVTGPGQAHFYVDDGKVDVTNVENPDDRASALWIYGTSRTDVELEDRFTGVIYAPDSDELTIADDSEIYGAVVGGTPKPGRHNGIGEDVSIHFDESIRTAAPIPPKEYTSEITEKIRKPIDVTFVLDASGSMGPHNTHSSTYYPIDWNMITTDDWKPLSAYSIDEPFRRVGYDRLQVKDEDGNIKTLSSYEAANEEQWEKIRVHPDDCWGTCGAYVGFYETAGNDPYNERVSATRMFIGMLNTSDRAAVYEFDLDARELHGLSGNFEAVNDSVTGSAYGGTNMAAGMRAALNEHVAKDEGAKKVMILLSDGKNSYSQYDTQMENLADRAARENVTVYTVGLGYDDLDEEILNETATKTGGYNVNVDDAEKLKEVFEGISEEVTEAEFDRTIKTVSIDSSDTADEYEINIQEHEVEIESS